MHVEHEVKQVPVTTYKEETTVKIELTLEEAAALKAVLGNVGGHVDGPDNLRDYISPLWKKLDKIPGLSYMDPGVYRFSQHIIRQMEIADDGIAQI